MYFSGKCPWRAILKMTVLSFARNPMGDVCRLYRSFMGSNTTHGIWVPSNTHLWILCSWWLYNQVQAFDCFILVVQPEHLRYGDRLLYYKLVSFYLFYIAVSFFSWFFFKMSECVGRLNYSCIPFWHSKWGHTKGCFSGGVASDRIENPWVKFHGEL